MIDCYMKCRLLASPSLRMKFCKEDAFARLPGSQKKAKQFVSFSIKP